MFSPLFRDSELAVLWAPVNEPPPKLSERWPEFGNELDEVLVKALAKLPEKRYSNCRELVEAARRALPEPPAPVAPSPEPALAAASLFEDFKARPAELQVGEDRVANL